MTAVKVITVPSLEGKRRAFLLAEDRIGHYPEFRAFFADSFDLDRVGLREPGYVAAPSGTEYALVFIGRSGESFPRRSRDPCSRPCAGAARRGGG